MMTQRKNERLGSSFESFLREEGLYEDATVHAVKTVLAWQIQKEMQEQGFTKTRMAERMQTSRSQLDRLLDVENDQVSLSIIQRAASAVGKRLKISLEDIPRVRASV